MNTPICDFVNEYVKIKAERLHMPGHKGVPLLGAFAEKGVTHYVKFDDVKKLVTTLFKEMAVAKGILKGN